MKLRFLLTSIWAGECSSSSLSFCSWPGTTHSRGQGAHHTLAAWRKAHVPFFRQPTASLHLAFPAICESPVKSGSFRSKGSARTASGRYLRATVGLFRARLSRAHGAPRPRPCPRVNPCESDRKPAGQTHFCRIGAPPRSTPCSHGSPGTASPRRPPAAGTPSPGGGPRSASETVGCGGDGA